MYGIGEIQALERLSLRFVDTRKEGGKREREIVFLKFFFSYLCCHFLKFSTQYPLKGLQTSERRQTSSAPGFVTVGTKRAFVSGCLGVYSSLLSDTIKTRVSDFVQYGSRVINRGL